MKNLIIVGPPRCGKTTLAEMIADKYPCEIIHSDVLITTLQKSLLMERIDETGKSPEVNFVYPAIDDNAQIELLKTTYEALKRNIRGRKKTIILDAYNLSFSKLEEEFGEDAEIYCFGVPKLDAEDLFKYIRLYDTYYDWTYCVGKYSLSHFCNVIVEQSKNIQEELKNYPNIKFVDTSVNRREILEKTFKEIEENVINV